MRRTPLARRTQLARRLPMPRSQPASQRRSTPPKQQADVYAVVRERSRGRCEALWADNGTWARCTRAAVDPQHRITRARGGLLLDTVGDTANVVALCRDCHRDADNGPPGIACRGRASIDGQLVPLLASGRVTTDKLTGAPVYTGPDEFYAARYPAPARRQP